MHLEPGQSRRINQNLKGSQDQFNLCNGSRGKPIITPTTGGIPGPHTTANYAARDFRKLLAFTKGGHPGDRLFMVTRYSESHVSWPPCAPTAAASCAGVSTIA